MLTIDGFAIDAEISSDHVFENEVTDYPVEVGADRTDHSRPKPIMLTIDGVVSDTPIGAMAVERLGVALPSADALAKLTAIRDSREPVAIATSLRRYDSMAMVRLQITKDVSTGRALAFVAEFKQIGIVTNERVVTRTVKPATKSKVDRGNKASTPVTTVPPKAPTVDTSLPAVRKVSQGGTGFAPGGRIRVSQGGSGIPTRFVGVRESPL